MRSETGSIHEVAPTPTKANPSYSLRSATHEDLEAVRELLRRCSLPTGGLEDQFGEQYAIAVSDRTGEIVGVAGYELHGSYGLLRSAAVRPGWQDRGIGSELTRDRIVKANENDGVEQIYALTTTADEFFQRFGFVAVDRTEVPEEIQRSSEFDEICPSSATVLRRAASEKPNEHGSRQRSSIACNLTVRQEQEWRDEFAESVLEGLEEICEMEDGFAFRFPGGEAVDEKLEVLSAWISGERKCCPFYHFEIVVEPEDGPVWLRLRGSEEVKAYTASELRDFDPTGPRGERLREWFSEYTRAAERAVRK